MTTQSEVPSAPVAENLDDVNSSDLIHQPGAELEDSSEAVSTETAQTGPTSEAPDAAGITEPEVAEPETTQSAPDTGAESAPVESDDSPRTYSQEEWAKSQSTNDQFRQQAVQAYNTQEQRLQELEQRDVDRERLLSEQAQTAQIRAHTNRLSNELEQQGYDQGQIATVTTKVEESLQAGLKAANRVADLEKELAETKEQYSGIEGQAERLGSAAKAQMLGQQHGLSFEDQQLLVTNSPTPAAMDALAQRFGKLQQFEATQKTTAQGVIPTDTVPGEALDSGVGSASMTNIQFIEWAGNPDQALSTADHARLDEAMTAEYGP